MADLFGPVCVLWDCWRVGRSRRDLAVRRQRRRFVRLVDAARRTSPYYAGLYAGLPDDIDDPRRLPPVSKRDLMEHFDDWVTDPRVTLAGLRRDFLADLSQVGAPYLGEYHVFTTSGTTGEPAVILHDRRSWTVFNVVVRLRAWDALFPRARDLLDLRRGIRSAGIYATGGHYGAYALVESVRRRNRFFASHVRMFSVLRPLPEMVAGLNAFRPTMLSAYPSALALLAGEQRAGRLHIRPFVASCSGEGMTSSVRREVEGALGCRVVLDYAATEVPAITAPCSRGAFHVNLDWYLLEPVDEHYRPVPPGTPSYTVLVTNLANRVQPLIRYDLGDRVTLSPDPCPCGSRLPTFTVEGRTNDVIELEGGDGTRVALLPLAVAAVLEEAPGVHRFQVIATGPRELTLRVEPEPGVDLEDARASAEERLRRFLDTQGVGPVGIEHAAEPPRPDVPSGKFRQVWRAGDAVHLTASRRGDPGGAAPRGPARPASR